MVYETDKFPYIGFSVLKEEKNKILKKYQKSQLSTPLKIMSCNSCKHGFQSMDVNDELMNLIYSELYNYPSPMLTGFSQEREQGFLEFFDDNVMSLCNKKGLKKVLEIASFDGYVLNELAKKGFTVTGCDPSKGSDIAKQFGIKVYKRFFKSNDFVSNNEFFDVIIFRHFIEHVYDPISLLNDVKTVLTKDGIMVFETPNSEYYMDKGCFDPFNFQHLHNFSMCSVNETLKKAYLALIDYKTTPANLIAIAAKAGMSVNVTGESWIKNVNGFKEKFQNNVDSFHQYIEPFIKQKEKIVIWGAGGMCGYLFPLYNIDESNISYIVDIDERKWEMCFLDKELSIYSPERLVSDNVSLVVIASTYKNQVLKQIKEMKIKVNIICLHPSVTYYSAN